MTKMIGMSGSRATERVHILEPYISYEAMRPREAARIADVTERAIRNWCEAFGLGRKIGKRWAVSRVALHMHLEGNTAALTLYHDGNRCHPAVMDYFRRFDIPLPKIIGRIGNCGRTG